jgi:hypothetical protein
MKTVLILIPDGNVFVIGSPDHGNHRCKRPQNNRCIEGIFICHSEWSLPLTRSWVSQAIAFLSHSRELRSRRAL